MKVLYVVEGGAVIDGVRLNKGMTLGDDHRSFKKILERLKGVVEDYAPGCRAILCDEEELQDKIAEIPKIKEQIARISLGEYREQERPVLIKQVGKVIEPKPLGSKMVVTPEGMTVTPMVADVQSSEDGDNVDKVVAPKKGRAKS